MWEGPAGPAVNNRYCCVAKQRVENGDEKCASYPKEKTQSLASFTQLPSELILTATVLIFLAAALERHLHKHSIQTRE